MDAGAADKLALPAPTRPRLAPSPINQVELCGRMMHIGRPKGYVAPAPGEVVPPATAPKEADKEPKAAPPQPMAIVGGVPTTTLLLTNLLPAGQLRGEEEREVVS